MRNDSGFKPESAYEPYITDVRLLKILIFVIILGFIIPLTLYIGIQISFFFNYQVFRNDLPVGIFTLILFTSGSAFLAHKGLIKQRFLIRRYMRSNRFDRLEGVQAFIVGVMWLVLEILSAGIMIWLLIPYTASG